MSARYQVGSVVFDHWVLEREIGAGGYGVVYEARREEYGKVYKSAIKILTVPRDEKEIERVRSTGMDDASVSTYFEGVVENLVNEVALMSRFKGNSNVVSYEDHKVIKHEDGIGSDILIRMELLTPFPEYLRSTEFRRSDVIKLGIGICNALELCQNEKVIHRDVKQDNIFVSERGDFKLGDFGVARIIKHTSGNTAGRGTEEYMAPEVRKGEHYGSTVDIYSLGIVLYRLLNDNRMPFVPQYPQTLMYEDHERAEALRISGAKMQPPRNADKRLAQIVLKACAYRARDRYQTPAALREDLRLLLTGADKVVPGTSKKDGKRGRTDKNATADAKTAIEPADNQKNKKGKETVAQKQIRKKKDDEKTGKKTAVVAAAIALILVAGILFFWLGGTNKKDAYVDIPGMLLISEGNDGKINYSVTPEPSNSDELTWSSSDDNVVHVVGGTLIGRGAGEAVVQLTYRDKTDRCRVFVTEADLGGEMYVMTYRSWYYEVSNPDVGCDVLFRIEQMDYLYDEGREYTREELEVLENAAWQTLGEYTQSDRNGWLSVYADEAKTENIGSVVLAENTAGEAVIVVYDGSRTYILGFADVVDPATVTVALELSETELTLKADEKHELKVRGIQKDGSVIDPENLQWSSSDEKVCTVKNGKVQAVGEGSAEITVTDGSVSAGCKVRVEKPEETEPPTQPPETKPTTTQKPSTGKKPGSGGSSGSNGGSSGSGTGMIGNSGEDDGGNSGFLGSSDDDSSGSMLGSSD